MTENQIRLLLMLAERISRMSLAEESRRRLDALISAVMTESETPDADQLDAGRYRKLRHLGCILTKDGRTLWLSGEALDTEVDAI